MASISCDPGGRRRILFVDSNGDRKAIRLGKVAQRAAEAIKFRVEQLLAAMLTGHPLEADSAYATGMDIHPNDYRLLSALAHSALLQHQWRRSIEYGERAIAVTPEAAARSSGSTTASVYDWRVGTSICEIDERSR